MFKFLKSKKHRFLYLKLAFKHGISPDHVRRLAHGKEYDSDKEKKVHDILISRGLIQRHIHHRYD